MGKLKPPTPTSVSATLRYAGFGVSHREQRGATLARTEGYRTEWQQDTGSAVVVAFETADADLHSRALGAMTDTLTRKGWSVDRRPAALIVRER